MDLKPSLYDLELEELEQLTAALEVPRYRAAQLAEWIYQRHITEFKEALNLPANLREHLQVHYVLRTLTPDTGSLSGDHESRTGARAPVQQDRSGLGEPEARKFVFKTRDGHLLESVLIAQRRRRTVCVSTQLGCKIRCSFCASGKGPFGRNLTAGEIVEQVAWVQKDLGARATNVVFMGMGEPLDNFEATMKALLLLQAPWGFGMGARHITVSTSGLTPKIVEFVQRNEGRVRLSVSLHSTNDAKRTELVPINRKYPLRELMQTLKTMNKSLSRKITFEYTLIHGENDSDEEVAGLIQVAKSLNALVNIIPYNPIREMNYERPTEERIKAFRTALVQKGVRVMVRQTAGRDIDAACGQLRLDRQSGVKGEE